VLALLAAVRRLYNDGQTSRENERKALLSLLHERRKGSDSETCGDS
jgi:hypothetical protein